MNDIERAINLYKDLLDMAEYNKATYKDFCETTDLTKEQRKKVYDDVDKNINMHKAVILALEKQIAKKPIEATWDYEKGYECPICGYVVNQNQKYCSTCGQKLATDIDWEWDAIHFN